MENQNKQNIEIYNKFINNIAAIGGNSNSNLRDHTTMSKNPFNQEEINNNSYHKINEQSFYKQENYNRKYEKMNNKIINNRRTIEFNQNSYYNSKINQNGYENGNIKQNNQNKIYYDNTGEYPLGGGKNAPIVKILNQYNNQSSQNNEYKKSNNSYNYYNPFIKNNNSFGHNNNHINPDNPFQTIVKYQNERNNINENKNNFSTRNSIQNHIIRPNSYMNNNHSLETSQSNASEIDAPNDENLSNSEKRSTFISSLLYGLIFGSFGTLLLWCRHRRVREYLKACYHNINSESILNFLKSFLHPIDLIKSLGINGEVLKEIIKQSSAYLSGFINENTDLWRLLGIIIVVYAFWLIIKIIYKLLASNSDEEERKEMQKDEVFQRANFLN